MQAWLAFWNDGHTRRSKTFSSKIHGFEEARTLAVEFILHKRKEATTSAEPRVNVEKNIPVVETSKRLRRRQSAS
jgi:hypothetical protein